MGDATRARWAVLVASSPETAALPAGIDYLFGSLHRVSTATDKPPLEGQCSPRAKSVSRPPSQPTCFVAAVLQGMKDTSRKGVSRHAPPTKKPVNYKVGMLLHCAVCYVWFLRRSILRCHVPAHLLLHDMNLQVRCAGCNGRWGC